MLGWTPEEAIGKHFYNQGEKTVIGVIKDFHMHSLHQPIRPLMLRLHDNAWRFISVKVRPEDISKTIKILEKSLKQITPYPFEYQFLDDQYNQLYESEMKMGEILGFFTFLSILIGSLGVFGMAAFTTSQRSKEIGIRKAMGASVRSIILLLSKDYIKLVLISFILAFPLSWYANQIWLKEFVYRIDNAWWILGLSGLMVLLIAYVAIGYQSIRAALNNPIDSLRNE